MVFPLDTYSSKVQNHSSHSNHPNHLLLPMQDTYRHQGLRKKLIDSLRKKGGFDERVLAAMEAVPRHFFLRDSALAEQAYQDKAFGIGCEQTISQPYTVAIQTQLLQIKKRQRILEIGTGSGYQAAILAEMGARVFTVERQEALFHRTRKLLADIGYGQVRCYFRDGSKGLREFAPYDGIVVTAGATEVPSALLEQLKIGGRLVIPVGEGEGVQTMKCIIRKSEKEYVEEEHGGFRFVPFLPGTKRK